MKEFIYLVRPKRPKFMETITSEEEAVVGAHFEYLKKATKEGKVVLAGPCLDSAFGVIVFRAKNMDQANDFMNNDPSISGDVFSSELHEFRISLLGG